MYEKVARRPSLLRLLLAGALVLAADPWAGHLGAIEVAPNPAQIQEALERGKAAAVARTPPDRLYAWFGGGDSLEPYGFLMTKLAGIAVMAAHFALRSKTPGQTDIQQILDDQALLVSVEIFGDHPTFAVDSYMVMVQGARTVKPVRVRFDGRASRSSAWPEAPAFRAKVVASFAYDQLDPQARTKLSVFPGDGGEVSFDLNFTQIE
ncbi:MAG: hypothetical protein ACE5NA_03625 [Nitrospiraceae bacterium]